MEPKVILSPNAPTPPPFLSQAITLGNITFCSGQVGVEPETGVLVEGTIQDRTRRIMLNLKAVLEAAGTSLSSVVKANIYLTNLENFSAVNEIYSEFFPDMKPARTCVGVRQLPLGTDVEIECIANNKSSNESRL